MYVKSWSPKVPDVESKVAALIISNKISARIDSTNATLHAKHTEQRGISCRKVGLGLGWDWDGGGCFCSSPPAAPPETVAAVGVLLPWVRSRWAAAAGFIVARDAVWFGFGFVFVPPT